ncbi:hypothetical protein CP985_14095 [Malaciobacter mytili LMG 24559]|uniref:Uncharacterized protein n=1 Tax=Malaciobacter mytili LMG 24559 TaxID=1032238 RepID=A0AAX2ABF1_9BACT|nr:hypothetical protein [Malaciobacter mytili]AXH16485.1 hypothetical protein AMYT_a0187 [Malaciobacter mytili LMG 24559]RXK12878.1 hypothetical protein CP985_14095 [Malaciobacter mytili LMG 24559]
MTYEILEYNQDENIDETYNHDVNHPIFYNMTMLKNYIKRTGVYGKVFEYDDTEWAEYHNADDNDYSVEIPEPMGEYITSELVE